MNNPTESNPDAESGRRPGESHPIIWYWSTKGGCGTSTIAAGTAIRLASKMQSADEDREVVLIDLTGDQVALLGLVSGDKPDTPGISDWLVSDASCDDLDGLIEKVAPGLGLVRLGTRSPADLGDHTPDSRRSWRLVTALQTLARPDRVVVVDAGLDLHQHRSCVPATPVCVIRACYLALNRGQRVPGPYERIVLIEEPSRALRVRDVAAALGASSVERVAWDPRVARSVDAGTIVSMLPPPLRRRPRRGSGPLRSGSRVRALRARPCRIARIRGPAVGLHASC
ncbi:MAG: hypothetical protein F4Z31_02210 [Gemmatimonadetes bacterium]|nr:hypothetical protein [Gemmatimonadota bacterium]